jgi:hypothetical protein
MAQIPKIKTELKANELLKTASALAELPFGFTRNNRTKINILDNVCEYLLKKQISHRHSATSLKISLEYFEADYLEKYLIEFNSVYNDPEIQCVIDKLNQKLA